MNYASLAKSYHPLLYKPDLVRVLNSFYETDRYSTYPKERLHRTISDILLREYRGEELYKYLLAREFYNKKVIAAFEVPVNRSRLDFLTINGNTRSFEIKSVRDSLNRLGKQLSDYSAVFEYNYIVTDSKHARQVLDTYAENYGVWIFANDLKKEERAPQKTANLNSEHQLLLCNKKELRLAFGSDNKAEILSQTSAVEINRQFKELLKRRYRERWKFISDHKKLICPIDTQFFFKSNINPELIYNC